MKNYVLITKRTEKKLKAETTVKILKMCCKIIKNLTNIIYTNLNTFKAVSGYSMYKQEKVFCYFHKFFLILKNGKRTIEQ